MNDRNRNAIISEDGKSIIFMHEGQQWTARLSAPDYSWDVEGPNGMHGYGLTIWAGVEDAWLYAGKQQEKKEQDRAAKDHEQT